MSSLKYILVALSILNLCLPLQLHAAENNYNLDAALGNLSENHARVNFESVWMKLRSTLPQRERRYIDTWVLLHPNYVIPPVERVRLKAVDGAQAIRLIFDTDKEMLSLEFKHGSVDEASLNGLKFSPSNAEALSENLKSFTLRPGAKSDTAMLLSASPLSVDFATYKKLSVFDKANFLVNRRLLLESANAVLGRAPLKAKIRQSAFWQWLMPTVAIADESKFQCPPGQTACDPILYGVDRNSGQGFCANQKQTCGQLSPLRKSNLQADGENLIQGILKSQGKTSAEAEAFVFGKKLNAAQFEQAKKLLSKDFDAAVTDATKQCEVKAAADAACNELFERRENFNSYLVDLKSKEVVADAGARTFEKQGPAGPPNLIDSEAAPDSCNWYCRNKSWAMPAGIVGVTILGIAGICATKKFSFMGLCTKNQTASTSNTTNVSTAATAPAAPSAADYTGVK